jgi:hypothetical protein
MTKRTTFRFWATTLEFGLQQLDCSKMIRDIESWPKLLLP